MRSFLLALMLAVSPAFAADPVLLYEGSNVAARLTQEPCDSPEIQLAFAMYFGVEDNVLAGTGHFQKSKDETFKLCWTVESPPEGQRVYVIDESGHHGFIKLSDLKPERPI